MAYRIPFTNVSIDLSFLLDLVPHIFPSDRQPSMDKWSAIDTMVNDPDPVIEFQKSPPTNPTLPTLTIFEEMILEPDAAKDRADRLVAEKQTAKALEEQKAIALQSSEAVRYNSYDENTKSFVSKWLNRSKMTGESETAAKLFFVEQSLCPICGYRARPLKFSGLNDGLSCSNCVADIMTIKTQHGTQVSIMRDNHDTERSSEAKKDQTNSEKFANNICALCGGMMRWHRGSTRVKDCQDCGQTIEAVYRGKKHFRMKVLRKGSRVLPATQLIAPMPEVALPRAESTSAADVISKIRAKQGQSEASSLDPMYKNAWGNMF